MGEPGRRFWKLEMFKGAGTRKLNQTGNEIFTNNHRMNARAQRPGSSRHFEIEGKKRTIVVKLFQY